MKNDNIYSALLDVLQRPSAMQSGILFGTLAAVDPLTIQIGDQEISEGLIYPRGTAYYEEDIGSELAILPCEKGLLLLFYTEGGETV